MLSKLIKNNMAESIIKDYFPSQVVATMEKMSP